MRRFSRRQSSSANPASSARARGSGRNSRSWRASKSNRPEISAARSARCGSSAPAARLIAFASSSALPGATTQPTSCSVTVSAASASGFGNQDHRSADRQQIVEPARHRYARDVLAVGNDPDIGGRKKRLQLVVLDAVDQRDVRKLRLGLHLAQLIEPDPPARQQEVNIPVVAQQPRRLEYDDGIMGKAEIAGQTDDEARRKADGDTDYRARPRERRAQASPSSE